MSDDQLAQMRWDGDANEIVFSRIFFSQVNSIHNYLWAEVMNEVSFIRTTLPVVFPTNVFEILYMRSLWSICWIWFLLYFSVASYCIMIMSAMIQWEQVCTKYWVQFMYYKLWVIKQELCRHQVLTRQFTVNNLDQILQHFEVAKDNYF